VGSRIKTACYQIVDSLSGKHTISLLLEAAKVSRSGFCKWRRTQAHADNKTDDTLQEKIQLIHSQQPFYGYRRVTAALRRDGIIVNHKRVYRLMKTLGLQSTIRKKRSYFGRKGSSVFPNVLNRNFASTASKEKMVTDITYLPVTSGFIYLSVIQDLHHNEIISYKIGKRNSLSLVLDTLEPLKEIKCKNAVLHSDQGFQYTSTHCKPRSKK
jgi:transposase InsO family protein